MTGHLPDLLVDTGVAVSLVIASHSAHEAVIAEIGELELGLAGHAWFETYSVLIRLPPPARCTPLAARRLIEENFARCCFLDPSAMPGLLAELATLRIAGGATYDGLVAATARAHSLPSATRDQRAAGTYEALEVDVRYIG